MLSLLAFEAEDGDGEDEDEDEEEEEELFCKRAATHLKDLVTSSNVNSKSIKTHKPAYSY